MLNDLVQYACKSQYACGTVLFSSLGMIAHPGNCLPLTLVIGAIVSVDVMALDDVAMLRP